MSENDSLGGYKIAKIVHDVIRDNVNLMTKRGARSEPYVNYTPKYISLKFDYLHLSDDELKAIDDELAVLFPRRYIKISNRRVPEYSGNKHWKVNVQFSKKVTN